MVDDVYNGGKSGYYHIKESNDQYTYLDTKWDYQTKTYTATLPETLNGQKVMLGQRMIECETCKNQGLSVIPTEGGAFKILLSDSKKQKVG